jgi:hypothetical protein
MKLRSENRFQREGEFLAMTRQIENIREAWNRLKTSSCALDIKQIYHEADLELSSEGIFLEVRRKGEEKWRPST